MTTIAYSNPFVPPEWIAAHGLRPLWTRLHTANGRPLTAGSRSVCPFAGALMDDILSGPSASAAVLTTTCDQMRYAAALLQHRGDVPIFLMHVPTTWQTPAARRLYLDELKRLGRFLVERGGTSPSNDDLAAVMLRYADARKGLLDARAGLPARPFADAVVQLRSNGRFPDGTPHGPQARQGVPLAIVGGPLTETDGVILDQTEQAGGRIVLDATEGGERTLPADFDHRRVQDDPLAELARGYFGAIPDAFRRPNDPLHEWLSQEIATRQVRGILFHRYVWCDIWHAELHRLKQWSPVPVVEIDTCCGGNALARTTGRIDALLEMLKADSPAPAGVHAPACQSKRSEPPVT